MTTGVPIIPNLHKLDENTSFRGAEGLSSCLWKTARWVRIRTSEGWVKIYMVWLFPLKKNFLIVLAFTLPPSSFLPRFSFRFPFKNSFSFPLLASSEEQLLVELSWNSSLFSKQDRIRFLVELFVFCIRRKPGTFKRISC